MKEFRNQVVHFAIGAVVSGLVAWVHPAVGVLCAFSVGITVEVCQYLYNDGRALKIADRLLDVSSYVAGGAVVAAAVYFLMR